MDYLAEFTNAYIECAIWSSTVEVAETKTGRFVSDEWELTRTEPMDSHYGADDLTPEAREQMAEDCRQFVSSNRELLSAAEDVDPIYGADRAGHDFWLTRNGHGAGFWDRGLGATGDRLTEAANAYGSADLYVDDSGSVSHF